MKDNIAVSIIVPIYNAEHFLKKGLDSCVNQTMQNIEIICVNDVSQDSSALIIEEYVKKYPNKIIHLDCAEKRGQGGARNQGILHARGEYLCFMDSDDYLDLNLCEEVYAEAKKQEADMAFYDFIRVDGEQEYPVELIGEEEIDVWYSHCGWAVWMQMVKREVILKNGLFLPENMRSDDDAMVHLWKYYAQKRIKMHKPYYYYVCRNNSLTNKINLSFVMAPIIGVIPYRFQVMQEKGLLKNFQAESDLMIAKDIYRTLVRMLKLGVLTSDIILYMRQKLEFLDGHILDESILKYNLQQTELNIVKDFLYHTEVFLDRYYDYSSLKKMRIEQGLDREVLEKLSDFLVSVKKEGKCNIAIWGAGEKSLAIISSLMKMGYKFDVFDNAKYGQDVWENCNKYIHSFEELESRRITKVFVASDFYFKAIQKQIYVRYPEIEVVNLIRIIRKLVNK